MQSFSSIVARPAEVHADAPEGRAVLRAEVTEDWLQGKAAFGGHFFQRLYRHPVARRFAKPVGHQGGNPVCRGIFGHQAVCGRDNLLTAAVDQGGDQRIARDAQPRQPGGDNRQYQAQRQTGPCERPQHVNAARGTGSFR